MAFPPTWTGDDDFVGGANDYSAGTGYSPALKPAPKPTTLSTVEVPFPQGPPIVPPTYPVPVLYPGPPPRSPIGYPVTVGSGGIGVSLPSPDDFKNCYTLRAQYYFSCALYLLAIGGGAYNCLRKGSSPQQCGLTSAGLVGTAGLLAIQHYNALYACNKVGQNV